MTTFNIHSFQKLIDEPVLADWYTALLPLVNDRLRPTSQRNFPAWLNALDCLPDNVTSNVILHDNIVSAIAGDESQSDIAETRNALLSLSPWRKGPFNLNGISIDSEWRCDLKWNRLAPHIDLTNKTILDVGSGNGYYSLRMLGSGAKRVLGLDTSLLFCTQFQAVTRFTADHRATVLPLGVEILEEFPCQFDTVFSMGVLYHRRKPDEHLKLLYENLRPGGELVLETLILHGHTANELIPPDRYANMRNVWSVPTLPFLLQQIENAGFRTARCIDVTKTTESEQRPTDWMTFRSLADALDPTDSKLTKEGHPAPLRAVIAARK